MEGSRDIEFVAVCRGRSWLMEVMVVMCGEGILGGSKAFLGFSLNDYSLFYLSAAVFLILILAIPNSLTIEG